MYHMYSRPALAIFAVLVPLHFTSAVLAEDAQTPLVAKRGQIEISPQSRSFAKELAQLAGKYPDLIARSSAYESMCEVNPKCFYVPNWTACCCDVHGEAVCEAWPPR